MSSDDSSSRKSRLQTLLAGVWALFIHAIFALLAAIGALIVHAMFRAWRSGEATVGQAIGVGAFGVTMTLIGLGFFYLAYVGAPRILRRLERTRNRYGNQPWLLNRQWRARRVVHSTRFTAWFMWAWCLIWWGIVAFLWSVNKDLILVELRGSWSQAIPASLPFVAGIVGLMAAVGLTWTRYRFGDAVLLIETLPGYSGEEFRCRVQARSRTGLQKALVITLTCGSLRKVRVRKSGGTTRWEFVTDVLWSQSQTLQPVQTTFDKGVVTVPIEVQLPSGLPDSGHILDDPQIVWKIEVTPRSVLDRNLASSFEIPIFARRERG